MHASHKGARSVFATFGVVDNTATYGYPAYESRRFWDASGNVSSEIGTMTPAAPLVVWAPNGILARVSGILSMKPGAQYTVDFEMMYFVGGVWDSDIPASFPSTLRLIVDGVFKCTLNKGVTSYFNANVGSVAAASGTRRIGIIAN